MILDLTSDIIVVFILIKLAEAMIYTFLACAPIGTSKLSFFNEASKDWNNLDNDIKNRKSLSFFKAKLAKLCK